jgi:hypothetical protein
MPRPSAVTAVTAVMTSGRRPRAGTAVRRPARPGWDRGRRERARRGPQRLEREPPAPHGRAVRVRSAPVSRRGPYHVTRTRPTKLSTTSVPASAAGRIARGPGATRLPVRGLRPCAGFHSDAIHHPVNFSGAHVVVPLSRGSTLTATTGPRPASRGCRVRPAPGRNRADRELARDPRVGADVLDGLHDEWHEDGLEGKSFQRRSRSDATSTIAAAAFPALEHGGRPVGIACRRHPSRRVETPHVRWNCTCPRLAVNGPNAGRSDVAGRLAASVTLARLFGGRQRRLPAEHRREHVGLHLGRGCNHQAAAAHE